MGSRIAQAVRGDEIVGLGEVQRGEKGLRCCVCKGKLIVRDGKGRSAKGKGRRNVAKRKHFAHVGSKNCYGEGMVHFILKTCVAEVIKYHKTSPDNFMGLPYVCPSSDYAMNCMFKGAPGKYSSNLAFSRMEEGHHDFDVLKDLHEVKCEHWLGGRKTRADIVGLDRDGNPLWVIEIKRTSVSDKAIQYAEEQGIPLFIIDVSHLPERDDSAKPPMMQTASEPFRVLMSNTVTGYLPRAVETYNAECEREAFGMGPTDTHWSKGYIYVCRGETNCGSNGCKDCEKVLIHECGGGEGDVRLCPDTEYMFRHGIGHYEMYMNPVHKVHSHVNN